jgi:hypothetical protein
MNAVARALLLEPSPPLAVDELEPGFPAHYIRVRDLRARFGDAEVYAAECSCGWIGEPHSDITAARTARRDGINHMNQHSPSHGHAGRAVAR